MCCKTWVAKYIRLTWEILNTGWKPIATLFSRPGPGPLHSLPSPPPLFIPHRPFASHLFPLPLPPLSHPSLFPALLFPTRSLPWVRNVIITISALMTSSGKEFHSLGAAIPNAWDAYVVLTSVVGRFLLLHSYSMTLQGQLIIDLS